MVNIDYYLDGSGLDSNHLVIFLVKFLVVGRVEKGLIVLVATTLLRDLTAVSAFAEHGPLPVLDELLNYLTV